MKKINYIILGIFISVIIIGCISRESDSYERSAGRQTLPDSCPEIRVFLATADSLQITSTKTLSLSSDSSTVAGISNQVSSNWNISLQNGKWFINNKPAVQYGNTIELNSSLPHISSKLTYTNNAVQTLSGSYRGGFKLIARPYGKIAIVNTVNLEDYIKSVVGSEVYASWHTDALRAQSIAARTYAIWEMNNNYRKLWDIGSDQGSQCYKGVAGEHRRISDAVNQTCGLVLTYSDYRNRTTVLPAFYSAVCGGSTQSGGPVFGYNIPQLPEKACPYCKLSTPANQYNWPDVFLSSSYVNQKLSQKLSLGIITSIIVSQKNAFGRAEYLTLTDQSGKSASMKAEQFRLALSSDSAKILSSLYIITPAADNSGWTISNGQGWGHGVGLCQRGAQQMAQSGINDISILSFYYPKAIVRKAY